MKSNPLPRSTPRAEGINSRNLIDAVNALELRGIELHSIMAAANGRVIFEGSAAPYHGDIPHIIHSMTKGFTNTAVGMAYSQGLLRLDDRLVDFFPQRVPENAHPWLREMTVEHLITMRCGHGREIGGNEWRPLRTSWMDAFFREPMVYRPGEKYVYSSANSYMLSAIVQRVTGMTAHQYLRDTFARKIGMREFTWDISPEGICSGGNGISLCIEDIVRFGLVYQQGGLWEGEQVIDPMWVDRSFGRIDRWEPPEGERPYNYHWFQNGNVYASSGLFGQHCIVVPDLHLVIGVTSACQEGRHVVDEITEALVAPLMRERGIAPQGNYDEILMHKGRRLNLLWCGRSAEEHLTLPEQAVYAVTDNGDGVSELALDVGDDAVVFSMTDWRGEHRVHCGLGRWIDGSTSITGGYLHHQYEPDRYRVVGMAWWESKNVLCMEWRLPEMAFCDYVTLTFSDDGTQVALDRSVNVNSQDLRRPTAMGKLK